VTQSVTELQHEPPTDLGSAEEREVSLVEIKRFAKQRLRGNGGLLGMLMGEPDYLPRTTASHTKLLCVAVVSFDDHCDHP